MKKYFCAISFLMLTCICFCQIFEFTNNAKLSFPEDVYLQDCDSGFKIMIALQSSFLKNNYANEITETIINDISPIFKVINISFRDMILQYNTIDNIISSIEIVDNSAKTIRGVGVGSTKEEIIKKYQFPDTIINRNEIDIYLYEVFFPEINSEAEYTRIRFLLKNNMVIKMDISIVSGV